MTKQFTALILGLMLAAVCWPLAAQTYSFQSFSYPNAVSNWGTWAQGINNRGAVVGGVMQIGKQGVWRIHGFKRDANGVLEPPFLAAPRRDGHASGINDHGVIVGSYNNWPHGSTGFLLYHGVFTYYNVQPGWSTSITGINNKGDFVGQTNGYGFINSNGVVTKIQCPLNLNAGIEPHAIAADGTVVGACSLPSGDYVGFIRGPAGRYKIIHIPGASKTFVNGINNLAHQVVGNYDGHGFVYDYITDTTTTVDYPGASSTEITGINSHGVIVGSARDAQGTASVFIGTPQ